MQLNININTVNTKKTKLQSIGKRGLSHTPKSIKNIYTAIRLKQIQPQNEAKKQANQTSKTTEINSEIPIYEISSNDVTIDISNSVQYIMAKFKSVINKNAIIYKIEHGFKTTFFTH